MNYRNAQQSITGLQEQYVQESIDFIREHEPPEGYFVGFSGGKDSIVTLELVRMAGAKHQAYYGCTTIDPPEIYSFIKSSYPEVIWRYPKMGFWEGIKKKGPPYRRARWCCDVLKKDPTKNVPLKHRIMGIRGEESSRRSSRPRVDLYKNGQVVYKPILNWLEWQVWEFIEANKLPYPALYDEGFDRIGCIICPFLTSRKKAIAMARWPKTYRVFEKVVTEWFYEKQEIKESNKYKTPEEFIEHWYSD